MMRNILKQNKRKYIKYFIFLLLLPFLTKCETEKGPINTDVVVSPSTLSHGNNGTVEIDVTNQASDDGLFKTAESISINSIHGEEEIIDGPSDYIGETYSVDLSASTSSVDPAATETVVSETFQATNTFTQSFTLKLTITVDSDGGSDSDSFTYTILPDEQKRERDKVMESLNIQIN